MSAGLSPVRRLARYKVDHFLDVPGRHSTHFGSLARVIEVGKRGGCRSTPQAFIES